MNELLRTLPRVDDVLECIMDNAGIPRAVLLDCIREVLDNCRDEIIVGATAVAHEVQCAKPGRLCSQDITPTKESIAQQAITMAKSRITPTLRQVINATGIVLHTNLGRAPLAESVAEHVKQMALGYSTLEYDLQTGKRGSRTQGIEELLTTLTNAEAACIVNNNAAAVLLTLSALCAGREVIVSRGELVEIGGSFRVPEVISRGGAVLREVGATNKTHLSDYRNAIRPVIASEAKQSTKCTNLGLLRHYASRNDCEISTAAILKVHTSNYKIMGFTHGVSTQELAALSRETDVLSIYDLGSGSFVSFAGEPTVQQAVADGMDIICFSGDKLLGGPQCGIILGGKEHIAKIRTHPLYRALRADKLTLAALEATLGLYRDMDNAAAQIPTLSMLLVPPETLKEKAAQLQGQLNGKLNAYLQETDGQAGGGSLPLQEFKSWAVAIPQSPSFTFSELENHLRNWKTPIIARIHKDTLLLDVRTIAQGQFGEIAECLSQLTNISGGKK